MEKLCFNYREETAFRELLARIDSDTIRNVLSMRLQKDLLTEEAITRATQKIMDLKHASLQQVDDETYHALRSFLMRLDVDTVQSVYSRELFGKTLADSIKQEMQYAVFSFYANNFLPES